MLFTPTQRCANRCQKRILDFVLEQRVDVINCRRNRIQGACSTGMYNVTLIKYYYVVATATT